MMSAFRQIPAPLQKQTLIRLGIGVVFIALLISLLIASQVFFVWLPCAGAALFFLASAFALFRRAVLGEYVVIRGVCKKMVLTVAKRRAKSMILVTDEHTVQVALHGRKRKIPVGTGIDLYVANNTPIYRKGGMQMVYSYLVIEVRGKRILHSR